MQNQLPKMRKRYFMFIGIGSLISLLFLLINWKAWLISFLIVNIIVTVAFIIAVKQHKLMVEINNEFENDMMKEGRKVTTLTAEESWNFIKHGVAVPDGQQPIFLKESYLWQSKKRKI